LAEHGCRFDRHEHEKRGEGQVMVTVHREGRKAEVPLGGPEMMLTPVTLPPGRFKLVTRPVWTGSSLLTKTMGIFVVAALAAGAAARYGDKAKPLAAYRRRLCLEYARTRMPARRFPPPWSAEPE
jgi:hypothetical protein